MTCEKTEGHCGTYRGVPYYGAHGRCPACIEKWHRQALADFDRWIALNPGIDPYAKPKRKRPVKLRVRKATRTIPARI